MTQKNMMYLFAGTTVAASAAAAYFWYRNASTMKQLAEWYKNQPGGVKASLPEDLGKALDKVAATV